MTYETWSVARRQAWDRRQRKAYEGLFPAEIVDILLGIDDIMEQYAAFWICMGWEGNMKGLAEEMREEVEL